MILTFALLLAFQTQTAPAKAPIQDEPLTVPAIAYPADAKKARFQGTVQLQIDVDATGHVTAVQALSGPIPLRQAAIDAYAHATYSPILVNGKPAPAIITTSVNFTLKALPPDTDLRTEWHFGPGARAAGEDRCAARRWANTQPSKREFDARRLAPCRPVCAVSPTAYRPGTEVRAEISVCTPPQKK